MIKRIGSTNGTGLATIVECEVCGLEELLSVVPDAGNPTEKYAHPDLPPFWLYRGADDHCFCPTCVFAAVNERHPVPQPMAGEQINPLPSRGFAVAASQVPMDRWG